MTTSYCPPGRVLRDVYEFIGLGAGYAGEFYPGERSESPTFPAT